MSRTLGQKRAEYCLKKLKELKCGRGDFKKLSAGLPAMIIQNGFGQTLAFLAAKSSKTESGQIVFKKEDKHYAAFSIISGWLKDPEIKILHSTITTEKGVAPVNQRHGTTRFSPRSKRDSGHA